MLKKVINLTRTSTAWALYSQAALLLANFAVFFLLVKESSTEAFGNWALYITIISIADGFRQGILQNGLIRLLVQKPERETQLLSASLLINFGFVVAVSAVLVIVSIWVNSPDLSKLLLHAPKSLFGLATLHFVNTKSLGKRNYRQYGAQNISYLVLVASGLGYLIITNSLSFLAVINLQLLAALPPVVISMIKQPTSWAIPGKAEVKELLSFGKYVAGTNLMSMLFHKADVIMLAFFANPVAVALFHFATKIVGYTELPLNALSQVIYPELSNTHRSGKSAELKDAYLAAIIRLLAFVIPIIIMITLLKEHIVSILSSEGYEKSTTVILILLAGLAFKPFGRVFGLLLDAIGKPKVNFQMLAFSLCVNVCLNLILIPVWGVTGAAIATSSSIALTVITGQWRLHKMMGFSALDIIKKLKTRGVLTVLPKTKLT